MKNDGIPAGGVQFTFHLDRTPKLVPSSTASSKSISNHLNIQELWEKILLSHGRTNTLTFEPSQSKFVDKLPIIRNTQKVAKSTKLHTVSRCNSDPRSEIWLPIDNFLAWHMKKKELWRIERIDRRGVTHCPEIDCDFADSQSIRKSFNLFEQEQQRKDGKEVKSSKEQKRETQVEEKIAISLDALTEIDVFLHSITRRYWSNFFLRTDNACRQSVYGDPLSGNSKTMNRRTLLKRKSHPPSHPLGEGVPQSHSNKRRRVPMPEQEPQNVTTLARPSVIRFTTNVEEGMQSTSQPLGALCCKPRTKEKFQLVKVTVKWRIQQKRHKKKAFKISEQTAPQIIESTTRRSIARMTNGVSDDFAQQSRSGKSPRLSADASSPSLAKKFNLKEKIFAWDRNHLYEAKILKMKIDAIGCAKYLVHYVGYSKSQDRWLTSDFMLHDDSKVR